MYTILFVDYQVILAEDLQDITYMIYKLVEELMKWGLEINVQNIKCFNIGGPGQDFLTESEVIKNVGEYEYPGVTINENGKDNKVLTYKVRSVGYK